MADARAGLAHGQFLVHFGIGFQQGMHGAVAHRVRRELQAALDRRAHHQHEAFLRNEAHPAVRGVADAVDCTHAPRLAHVSAAREHSAIEERFDADDAQPIIVFLEERILTDLADARQDALQRANRLDVLR